MRRFLTAALWAALSFPAFADGPPCAASRAIVVATLAQRFGETPHGIGLAGNGAVIELFASNDGESWTFVMTFPGGRSCLMAAGQSWQSTQSTGPRPQPGEGM